MVDRCSRASGTGSAARASRGWAFALALATTLAAGTAPNSGLAAAARGVAPEAAAAGATAALVRRFVDEAWNAGRYEAIAEIFAADYVAESLNAGTPPLGRQTHAQLVAHVREFRDAMPDLRMTVEEIVESGDRAYVRTRLVGTQRGPLFGLPPSNRKVDVVLAAVYRSENGRLTGHTVLVDMLGLLQQIGALPVPPGATPPPPAGAMLPGPPASPPLSGTVTPGTSTLMPPAPPPARGASSAGTVPAQPRLLALEPGMRWTYRVSGSLQPAGAPAALPMGGTLTITIETLEFRGRPTPALKFAQDLRPLGTPPDMPASVAGAPPPGMPPPGAGASPPGGAPPAGASASIFGAGAPPVGIFWFRQDPATRDVYFVGDNHGPPDADGRPGARAARGTGGPFIPGAWRDGTSYSKRIDWDGGGWTHNWLAVLGTESIDTGLGPRLAWRAPNRSDSAEGIAIDGTDWWAPELGQPVKFEANTRLPDGTTIRIVAVLDSTNVAS